jgi:hypothetical protein
LANGHDSVIGGHCVLHGRKGDESVKLTNLDSSTLMEVTGLATEGNNLIIKGTILESMPVTTMLTPSEARKLFKLLTPRLFFFLLTLLFRR